MSGGQESDIFAVFVALFPALVSTDSGGWPKRDKRGENTMTENTKAAITAIAKADGGITPEALHLALLMLAGGIKQDESPAALSRAVKPKKAAEALDRSTKTLERYARRGLIRAIYQTAPNGKRRIVAYTLESINAFIGGKGAI